MFLCGAKIPAKKRKGADLKCPNAVVLNVVGCRNTQTSAKGCKRTQKNASAQRRRDDNKDKNLRFEGGGPEGREGKSAENATSLGKRHDNKILKVLILLLRHFVVIAQAPICIKIANGQV